MRRGEADRHRGAHGRRERRLRLSPHAAQTGLSTGRQRRVRFRSRQAGKPLKLETAQGRRPRGMSEARARKLMLSASPLIHIKSLTPKLMILGNVGAVHEIAF